MAAIKSYVQPTWLYRYRSLDSPEKIERELKSIEQAHLYCAPFSALNDPMEGFWRSTGTLRKRTGYQRFRVEININKAQLGICSFSEVHDHELMWAHYSDEFRGICIRYDLSKLLADLGNDATFVRMFYNESAPLMHSTDTDSHDLARRALSSKSYRWLYEREWRLFAPQGKASYKMPAATKSIFLGSRINRDVERRIRERMARFKIPVRAMSLNKYTIGFEPEK